MADFTHDEIDTVYRVMATRRDMRHFSSSPRDPNFLARIEEFMRLKVEGVGMGWVWLFEPERLRELLRMPEGSTTVAVLCLGYVKELYPRPLLEVTN